MTSMSLGVFHLSIVIALAILCWLNHCSHWVIHLHFPHYFYYFDKNLPDQFFLAIDLVSFYNNE